MGKYIEKFRDGTSLPSKTKASMLIIKMNASIINQPKEWREDLVCVVDNGNFEAAAYCQDNFDLQRFSRDDGRSKVWLELKGAKELAE